MASTAPYRQLCTKAAAVWARWGSAHDSAAGLLRTAGNVLSRLGPMQQAGHYGSLADDAELQVRSLELACSGGGEGSWLVAWWQAGAWLHHLLTAACHDSLTVGSRFQEIFCRTK